MVKLKHILCPVDFSDASRGARDPTRSHLEIDGRRGDVEFDIGTEVYVCVARTTEEAVANSRKTLAVLTEGFVAAPGTTLAAPAGAPAARAGRSDSNA